MEIQMTKGA